MEFANFLGNDALKQRLSAAARQNRLSHCYMICGPRGSGKHTLSMELAAYLQCTATGRKPCGVCGQCRKVRQGIHPDVIVVDEEKKNISVDLVRRTCANAYIKPNEGARKIFLIPRARALGIAGQNALLKLIEEPPSYATFFLLCDNPDVLLPTVRSRCAQLSLSALAEPVFVRALLERRPELDPQRLREMNSRDSERSDQELEAAEQELRRQVQELYSQSSGFLGQALELAAAEQELLQRAEPFGNALAAHDALAMTGLLASMEQLKREAFADTMLQWERLVGQAMLAKNGMEAVSGLSRAVAGNCTQQELSQAAEVIRRAYLYSQSNVGVGHLCGMLAASLIGRE